MTNQTFTNLTEKVLIASPFAMEGNVFYKSLIYVVKHTNEGSIGFIFNRPVKNSLADNLFSKLPIDTAIKDLELNLHIGGPIDVERGFFLHSNDYNKNPLFASEHMPISVSSNTQILQDIANGIGPSNSIFVIGYTGWSSGQLDFEIENNLWIVAEPNPEIIFSDKIQDKWLNALNCAGVSTDYFIPSAATC